MSDIERGDRVTVAGHGPYEVARVADQGLVLILQVPWSGDRPDHWDVPAEWCERVAPPWEPEPGTVWQGSTGVVVRVARNAAEVQVMGSIATYTVQDIHTAERPLVELVPKGEKAPVRTYGDVEQR